jgi:LacI family transcriptional regulator
LRVVPRASTDVLAVDNAEVAAALRFIREHAAKPIQVHDVVEHVSVSRRSLERHFGRVVGHPIANEIRRAHVERAKHLLMTSNLKLPQIAAGSGFTNATRLGIVFHRQVGEPPAEFRRRSRLGNANGSR